MSLAQEYQNLRDCCRQLVTKDLVSYRRSNGMRSGFTTYLVNPGYRFTVWFRLHQWASENSSLGRWFRSLLTWSVLRQSLKTGIQINPGARVGPGLYMPHFGGIVVNPLARIGVNCYLSHNVLIGKVHIGKRMGVPVIGDDVFIGAGAIILGNVRVGNNAAIGVNSLVLDDVPEGGFVAGAPARIVDYRGASGILGERPGINEVAS